MTVLKTQKYWRRALGIRTENIPITKAMHVMDTLLSSAFRNLPIDATEENIQARLRGNILMALSNKLGLMVLTTGNKSELSVGYATLYGDMCGGYSVLKDVYKTTVDKLCEFRNQLVHANGFYKAPKGRVIPERMMTKAPSAELKPDQTDQDTLPPDDVLDAMLRGLVEQRKSTLELIAEGMEAQSVRRVASMLAAAEYKRRQAAPGVKITSMAFGRDRRYPSPMRGSLNDGSTMAHCFIILSV